MAGEGASAVVDFEEVVRLDREYTEQWSLLLDLTILLRTIPAVFGPGGLLRLAWCPSSAFIVTF